MKPEYETPKMKTVYKLCVVRNNEKDEFWSLSKGCCTQDDVQYDIGKTTIPNKGSNPYLYAFNSLENARVYYHYLLGQNIALFEATASYVRTPDCSSLPVGTVFCADITLTKRIE